MTHSPEPWKLDQGHEYVQIIVDNEGREILNIRRPVKQSSDEFQANIERIIACVNGCSGITARTPNKGVTNE